jgi:hypothetical protein
MRMKAKKYGIKNLAINHLQLNILVEARKIVTTYFEALKFTFESWKKAQIKQFVLSL